MISLIVFLLGLAAFCGIAFAIYKLYNSNTAKMVIAVQQKQQEKEEKVEPYYIGNLRIGGLVEFQPVLEAFMLTNKGLFALPAENPVIISNIGVFNTLGLKVERAYLAGGYVIQSHYSRDGRFLDHLLMYETHSADRMSQEEYNKWSQMISDAAITTPEGEEYSYEWDSVEQTSERLEDGDSRILRIRVFGRKVGEVVKFLLVELHPETRGVRVYEGISIDATDVKFI